MQQQLNYYPPQDELDEELTIDLKKIFFALWSRKFLIAKVFVAVLAFFILLTFVSAKKYKVDADLYINKSNNSNMAEINPYVISELGAGGGMAALMSGGGTLANDIELMQSPLVIDKVIQDNDLRFKKLFGIIPTKKTGQYLTTEKFLKKGISFENKKGTNVVTIEYKNTLGTAGDKLVAYPFDTPLLPSTDPKYTAPAASAAISGTSGTTTMKINNAGYYSIYYLPEGHYETPVKTADILVGTPATLSAGLKYGPEDNIEITASNLSKKYNDWVGVFPFLSNIQTETPLYRVDLNGESKANITIPAGTLPLGMYRVSLFYNDSRSTSAISVTKLTVG